MSANNRIILGIDSALQLDLTLTDPAANVIPNGNQITTNTQNSRFPISGDARLAIRNDMVFTFNGIYDAAGTTLLTDHGVKQFGVTMLSRDNRDWTGNVVVTFSDNSTQTLSGLTVGQSVNTTDTFVGFAAPDNLFITQVAFTRTGGGEYIGGFDDLGIIVIPEAHDVCGALWVAGPGARLVASARGRLSYQFPDFQPFRIAGSRANHFPEAPRSFFIFEIFWFFRSECFSMFDIRITPFQYTRQLSDAHPSDPAEVRRWHFAPFGPLSLHRARRGRRSGCLAGRGHHAGAGG